MLDEQLSKRIDLMKEVQIKQKKVANIKTQSILDKAFSTKTRKIQTLVDSISVANDSLNVRYSEEIINETIQEFNKLIINLDSKSYSVVDSDVKLLDDQYSKLDKACKISWTSYYDEKVVDTTGILDIINNLNPTEFTSINNELKACKNWTADPEKLKNFSRLMDQADKEIQNLKLDEDIKSFLKKVKDNKASLLDLNEKIINWIKEETLEGKIKLRIGS